MVNYLNRLPSLVKFSSIKTLVSDFVRVKATEVVFVSKVFVYSTMASGKLLLPPESVKEMTNLDRNAFKKVIEIPFVSVNVENLREGLVILKPYLLKMVKFNPVQALESTSVKHVILNPLLVNGWECFKDNERKMLNRLEVSNVETKTLELTYDNWKPEEIFKAVLPNDVEGFSSYTSVGHIIQVNLRDHLLDYRFLIGQVLHDKMPSVSLVVNKSNIIDNTFRNFKMEVLAGEGSTVTKVKENNITFEFDFADVYWNSRLATEHERIVNKLKAGDILFDVFAGVGPFSIPAAKRKCEVFANDLNEHSVKWLKHNVKLNKVGERVQVFNEDGREFIKDIVKSEFLKIYEDSENESNVHIVMNLPALAVEFLDAFIGLGNGMEKRDKPLPNVHCYMFVRDVDWKEAALDMVRDNLKVDSDVLNSAEVFYVRHVAPMKEMIRVSFLIPDSVFFKSSLSKRILENSNEGGPECKKPCS